MQTDLEPPLLDEDVVSVDAARPRFLERIGFPADVKPVRESVFVVVLVAPILTALYRLWDAPWRVPWNYSGDALHTAAYTKTVIENGWYLHNPRLAAPFQADWRDFPIGGENIHWFTMKIIGTITGDWALSMNLYFVLGFFLIALVAHFVARYLGLSAPAALVIAVAFAFLPFHGLRNVAHLVRSGYYIVPLAVLVILWVANYGTDFLRHDDEGRRWRRGRLAVAVVIGIVLGASDTQNAAFMVSIVAVVALIASVRDRDWRPIALLAILTAATFGSLIVNNAPIVAARHERGPNAEVANRPLSDQDQYGLRPVWLVLPAPGHRIAKLAHLTADADKGKLVNGEAQGTGLGILGSIGLLFSLGAALALGLGTRSSAKRTTTFAAQLGTINLASILIGTVGGFAFLVALGGFTSYRTWNRISLYIAFSALLAVGLLLDMLFGFVRRRCSARRTLATIIITALVAVLCVGAAFDQITPQATFKYNATEARFNIDANFYHRLEASVPKGAMMFQLPFLPFPENGKIAQMTDYQEFTGFLHTDHLRWNYAGMKGRLEGDWEHNLPLNEPVATLASIAATGFQGVVIDRSGYVDGAANLLLAAKPYTGPPRLQSSDGRLVYLDLSAMREQLQREIGADAVQQSADSLLRQQWLDFSFAEYACPAGKLRWAVRPDASVSLVNSTDAPLEINPSTTLTANPRAERIDVSGPGFKDSVPLRNGTGTWQRAVTLPKGTSEIDFHLVGPAFGAQNDARPLHFALEQYSFGQQFDSPVDTWAQALDPNRCTDR